MQIKAEYINPSDLKYVILLNEKVSIEQFSQLLEKSWELKKIYHKGTWDGIKICYLFENQQIEIDDIYGGLRILLDERDKLYEELLEWIKSIQFSI